MAPRTGGQKEGSSKAPLSQTSETGAGGKVVGMDEGSPAPSGEYGRKKGALSGRRKTGLGAGEASDGNGDGRSEIDRSRGEGWRGGEWGSEGAPGSGRRGGLGARARAGLRLRGGEGS